MKRPFFYSSILLTIATLMASCSQKPSDKIYVSAAASLTEVLTEWDSVYCKPNGIELVLNFGSSGTLTRQIMSQAPCDVFIPASPENIDTLVACGIVNAEAIKPLAYGQLVLIATLKDSVPALALPCVLPQPTVKVAIGDTLHVPAGQYAVKALRKLGVLREWSPAFIPAANVKAALRLVESGETEYGFVFLSDALKNRNNFV